MMQTLGSGSFLSQFSTHSVPDSSFFAPDFVLGAGVVIIQPSSSKVVLVTDHRGRWFLPKGRKDKGESLEQAALREGYEESGYHVQFLPLYSGSVAPDPSSPHTPRKDTEPIFVNIYELLPHNPIYKRDLPLEYFTFYFVAQIPADAVREEQTGMANESSFVSHLFTINEALEKLRSVNNVAQHHIVDVAFKTWRRTLEIDEQLAHVR